MKNSYPYLTKGWLAIKKYSEIKAKLLNLSYIL